jgi:cytochrome c556
MIRRVLPLMMAGAVVFGLAGYATAQTNAVAAVEKRQAEMKKLGGAFKAILDYIKDGVGTVADVQAAAATVKAQSAIVPTLFPAGTALGVGKSMAKPELWEHKAEIDKISAQLQADSAKLVEAAASGDKAQIGGAFQAVGKNCQGCHTDYRQKKE